MKTLLFSVLLSNQDQEDFLCIALWVKKKLEDAAKHKLLLENSAMELPGVQGH